MNHKVIRLTTRTIADYYPCDYGREWLDRHGPIRMSTDPVDNLAEADRIVDHNIWDLVQWLGREVGLLYPDTAIYLTEKELPIGNERIFEDDPWLLAQVMAMIADRLLTFRGQ